MTPNTIINPCAVTTCKYINESPLKNGLPGGDLGRIGLAISPQKSNVVYALITAKEKTKGFYRSEDYGETWKKMSNYQVVDSHYYVEIFPDPISGSPDGVLGSSSLMSGEFSPIL